MAPTAAEQVFSIGELVKNILINLPDTTIDNQSEAFFQLFVLQSLNKTANLAIKSTKVIRQHMFLEPHDSSLIATRIPVRWLLRQLGIDATTSSNPELFDVRIQGLRFDNAISCKVHGYSRDCIAAFSRVEAYRALTWVHLKPPTSGVPSRSLNMRNRVGSESFCTTK